MRGMVILDNVKSADVMFIEDNVHVFIQNDGLSVEMVLTDELAEILRGKLSRE